MQFADEVQMTFPVIIMRTGGLDGVALQAREYRHLLNKLDIGVHVITGRCETKFAPANPIGHKQTIISRLDFYHRDSMLLFANQFTHGSEKDGVAEISDQEWVTLFKTHKEKIKKRIKKILESIPNNTPVLIYNLVSLRHAQPAAGAALMEIIRENPDRAFISHSADPDAERPEKIARIKPFVLPYISAALPGEDYSGGPCNIENLYHIVLNPTQHDDFINKYGIPDDHIFEIPDFLEFVSEQPVTRQFPRKIFISYLADRKLELKKDSYRYIHGDINKETVIFVSPVRPVYRKRLKEAMLLAREYGVRNKVEVAFVVTHPDKDDPNYFMDTVRFAEMLDLPYFHLGKKFSLEALDLVYENLAALKSIGMVASSAGGWENALNEMARACIPFCMDCKLNSFKPLTRKIGIKTHGADFGHLTPLVDEIEENGYAPGCCDNQTALLAFDWFDDMLDPESRQQLVEDNYRKAYEYLSHEATIPRLVKNIQYIYKRHSKPEIKPANSPLELQPA